MGDAKLTEVPTVHWVGSGSEMSTFAMVLLLLLFCGMYTVLPSEVTHADDFMPLVLLPPRSKR